MTQALLETSFPELSGFVLLNAAELDDIGADSPIGRNLLHLFSASGQDDQVVRDGIAIPALNIEPGFYAVLVRHARNLHRGRTPR
ncbi:hypothetical protein [Streptomyces chartreusis]|uniref:hypothetical protein n=1 Tax=Streptomyces chartreusis TaxID=1969 RepID=UPI00380267C1